MGVRDVRAASRAAEAERDAGVNDVRIVQRARVRLRSPPPSLHMLAPAAQPTLDKKNTPRTPRLLQWNNLPAQGNLHWSWADPRSRARPLKFWPLRLPGDTVSHCEFFFFSLLFFSPRWLRPQC